MTYESAGMLPDGFLLAGGRGPGGVADAEVDVSGVRLPRGAAAAGESEGEGEGEKEKRKRGRGTERRRKRKRVSGGEQEGERVK